MIYFIILLIAIWVIGRYEKGKAAAQSAAQNNPRVTGIIPASSPAYDIVGGAGTTITGGAGPAQLPPASAAFTESCGITVLDISAQPSTCAPPPFGLE